MLKVQEKGKPETAVWLDQADVIIANDDSGNLKFKSTTTDKSFVKIQIDNDRIYLADMTFNQPIFLNDQPIPPGSKRAVKHGDQIQIANSFFEILNPKNAVTKLQATEKDTLVRGDGLWKLKAVGNWLDGQVFKIQGKTVLGRDSTCDITIPGSHLSRRHVEFIPTDTTLHMKDLDSANGCFLNGKRCKEAKLKDGDEVKFDILVFRIIAPEKRTLNLDKVGLSDSGYPDSPIKADSDTDVTKNWVTKPTSVGNTEHDPHDIILASHIRNKRIMYSVFGILLIGIIVAIALLD